MHLFAIIAGIVLLVIVLADAFETVVLARRAQRTFRITRYFLIVTWWPYRAIARAMRSGRRREYFLSMYGPSTLILLLAFWAVGLIVAFALVQWGIHMQLANQVAGFITTVYFSGTAFLTLGVLEPTNNISKYLMVVEAGLGFSFLGLVIGYLPILYQSFSGRERQISLLDARAGSPPTAAELILRERNSPGRLEQQLADWEGWAAEVLESHISYPMLGYFRSQHSNQSWLAGLVTILDASALSLIGSEGDLKRQAELTFAMCRHALVDMATLFSTAPHAEAWDRLSSSDFTRLEQFLSQARTVLNAGAITESGLRHLRRMYEPFAYALGQYFLIALPHWLPGEKKPDNWQITSWDRGRARDLFAVSDPFSYRSGSED